VSRDLIFYADPTKFDSIRFLVELSCRALTKTDFGTEFSLWRP
jgi:hypothetical protein